ncbi:MAG TPA: Oar protein, partial [Oceanospirillales bacterium]|nr:Oar protein [Oceanospirillales bacterium]
MKNIKRLSWLFAAIMFVAMPINVIAQETSSAIGGTVVDSDGNPVSGATVIIKHIPTGATKTISTNNNGNYQARGLRVGGPYTVSVTNDGFGDVTKDDIYLKLGMTKDVDATIVSDSVTLDSISVVGVVPSSDTFNPDNMGTGSVVTREQIDNLASTDRSLADFARLDSRVQAGVNAATGESNGSFAAAGVNNRYNNISIDGVATNDEFGLEPTGQPGLSQSFSLDTIEELQIQLSPYDTALSNFVGLNVNAVTKSGTNELHGRVNLFYQDEGFARDGLNDFKNETYSVSLGGPIIKDKLFFFINYENKERTDVADDVTGSAIAPNADGSPNANVVEAARIAREVWGFDPGSVATSGAVVDDQEKILVKLDWEINEKQRLSMRYNQSEDSDFNLRHSANRDI